MDSRQSSSSAGKAALLQWSYDHMTRQIVHRAGCRICRDFFLHASEALLVDDVTYLEACKLRDHEANHDLEKEVQRLKDRVRRREDEIEKLRSQLAAVHERHGDDAMSLGEDHPAPVDTRATKKRRADDAVRTASNSAEAPRNAAGEAPQPVAGDTANDPGPPQAPGYAQPGPFMGPAQPMHGPMFVPSNLYAPPGMYAPPGNQPVVWPDGATWVPNDGPQFAIGGWGNAASGNWAADWRPNTYTSGSRTMDNNWASSSRAPDWSNRPWEPAYDHPGIVPWPETGRTEGRTEEQDRGSHESAHAPDSAHRAATQETQHLRGVPTGPRAHQRGRPTRSTTGRPPPGRRAPSTTRRATDPAVDAFLTDSETDDAVPASSSGGGTSSSATQKTDPFPDDVEIRRMMEEVKTPGNVEALRTLGKWRKIACEILHTERHARHWLVIRHYRRPQWARDDENTKKLGKVRLRDDAKKWHSYLRRYPGFKRPGLPGGNSPAPMDDILSYLRIARLIHDFGDKAEWTRRKKLRDAFVLAAAAIVETVDNYQRLRRLYGVNINPLGSTPDFGTQTSVTEQAVVVHLAKAGFTDYEAAAASHFAHAVLTDVRYQGGSQEPDIWELPRP
ncbi:hypothetical protein FA95DRAFT_1605110 [Auriscalpium vulgare]|uniref:Uncharacterized protein n=1 Tax=Auriscalpium vulgare TaxID=40419 RepID=A0ACB8RX21_9AGAM|nr:hypothetical protein FA95DRAFT_1605110 [Auriscalpium vulgare]